LQIDQPILKTKECRNFHKNHHCRFGDRCNFKHETNMRRNNFKLAKALK